RVHLDAGALRERGIDFVKRVLHGGSGKDGNTFFLARCEVSPEDCEKCQNNRGEPDNPAHSVLPKRFTTRMSACSALTPKCQHYPSYRSEDRDGGIGGQLFVALEPTLRQGVADSLLDLGLGAHSERLEELANSLNTSSFMIASVAPH